MSYVSCCTPCPEVQTVNVPGAVGATGAAGPAGADGEPGLNEWDNEFGADVTTGTALTDTAAALGGATPLTLPDDGNYMLLATVHLKWSAATTVVNHEITIVWRRTNHTAANISPVGGSLIYVTGLVTDESGSLGFLSMPPTVYAGLAGDTLELYGAIDSAPYVGELQSVQAGLLAVKLGA